MCLLTPYIYASYAVSVRQYRSLPFRFLQCIPHGKPPCDVLTVRDVTPACKGFAPSGNYFFSSNIVNLYAKICTFGIFTDLRWWVSCSCRAHTSGIFYCRVSAILKGCNSLQTSSWIDSEVLLNRQQKHTANRYGQFYKKKELKTSGEIIS